MDSNHELLYCDLDSADFLPPPKKIARPSSRVELLDERRAEESGDSGQPLPKKPRMQCALSPQSAAGTTTRSVAQRLKESSLKDGPVQVASTSARGPTFKVPPLNLPSGRGPSHPPLTRRQQNTIRIIAQYLKDLGLTESVESLVEESGCKVENAQAVRLREAILRGHWNDALTVLDKSYSFLRDNELDAAKLIILEEKFFDLLSKNETALALKLLREDYPQKKKLAARKTELVNLLFADHKDLEKNSEVQKHRLKSKSWRRQLALRIQRQLPPSYMLPPKRLEQLTEQAWRYQLSKCHLHFHGDQKDTLEPDSVFRNHNCLHQKQMFRAHQILRVHSSEIWCMEFSPDGSRLATGSKNAEIIIWEVDAATRKLSILTRIVHGEKDDHAITCLSWSADNRLLAVGGNEHSSYDACVYNVQSGSVHRVVRPQNQSPNTPPSNGVFTTVAFFHDSRNTRLVCADRRGHLQLFDMRFPDQTHFVDGFDGYRITWLHAFRNGACAIAADTHQRVRRYCFSTGVDETLFTEESSIYSFSVHPNERYLLAATQRHGVRIWDLSLRQLVRTLNGVSHLQNVVHGSFGGPGNVYACSGSLDGSVAVWNVDKSKPVARIEAHRGLINSAKWSPTDGALLVTAGDDRQIRVFVANLSPSRDAQIRRKPPQVQAVPRTGVHTEQSPRKARRANGKMAV